MPHRSATGELVRRAIAEPLMIVRGSDTQYPESLIAWGHLLVERYPLWAYRPYAFAALSQGPLPMTHPLPAITESIAQDEPRGSALPISLEGVLENRRCSLGLEDRPSWLRPHASYEGGEVRLIGGFGGIGFPRVFEGPVLAYHEPESQHTIGGYVSPYEEIGLELVNLVEEREKCRAGSRERQAAGDRLKAFLRSITASIGRPTELGDTAAAAIVEQGRDLFGVLWSALAAEVAPSQPSAEALRKLMADGDDPEEWAVRLTLPFLSRPEIRALRKAIGESARLPRGPVSPEELFTVRVLAHRLRLPVGRVARKVTSGWNAEYSDLKVPCVVCGEDHEQGPSA